MMKKIPEIIQVKHKQNGQIFLYDRNQLKGGYYKGIYIPHGGCIRTNSLIGLKPLVNNKLGLKKIGIITPDNPAFNKIPKLKGGKNYNENENKISLKHAIQHLREYYKNNIYKVDT